MKDRKKLNIGLTGSSGFLGSAILKHFKDNGDNVIMLDSLVHPNTKGTKVLVPDVLDWVMHFGATKSIEASFENPVDIYRRNMHSTMAALGIAISRNSRFLYMSSYVYGKPHYLPVDEKHPTFVLNPYMGSKLLGEQMCFQLHQCMDLSVLILRGFTFYGPKQKDDQLVPSILKSIRNHRPVVVKDPNPERDYLYISDFLRLIDIIVHSDYSGFEIYNVGGGMPYKNIEVAQMANNLSSDPVPIHIEGKERRNDVAACYANIEKIKRDFQWHPKISLPSGLYDCLSLSNCEVI